MSFDIYDVNGISFIIRFEGKERGAGIITVLRLGLASDPDT